MADVLIRNVDDDTLARIAEIASRKGHSLEDELREILNKAGRDPFGFGRFVQEQLADHEPTFDPIESIREDRESR